MATYRLDEEIGRGALGRVVRVQDLDSGRTYAGKILHDSFRDDPRAAERFAREARLLEGVHNEHIVRVHELATIEGQAVIVMELVEGPSLQVLLAREGPLPQLRLVRIARGIARALEAAHHRGLVHRDLKPGNVLVAPGDAAKLVDFGLARASSMLGVDRTSLTLVGTPDYMAPESLDPLAVDSRSDLYALGCVLFEMTAGFPPFGGASAFGILEAHRRMPPPALEVTPERSPGLVGLIHALLAKSPADRPQSAAAVGAALDELSAGAALGWVAPRPSLEKAFECSVCGAPLVERIHACFGCGRAMATVSPGRYTVFVVGPGQVAERLDAGLRTALVDWVLGNPALALDPEPLIKKSPRLPFRLIYGIDAGSAETLARSLRALGLVVEVRRGGPLALRQMREKVWKLSGRAAIVTTGSLIGGLHTVLRSSLMALVFGMMALGATAVGTGWVVSTRGATRPRQRPRDLTPDLQRALEGVTAAVPALTVDRHREALRGVVGRVLAFEQALGSMDRELQAELAQVVAAATNACLTLDQLDGELSRSDLREPGADDRRRLHERDRVAARLLEMTARLEALRSRVALAGARPRADALDDLRAQVEALEEVSRS